MTVFQPSQSWLEFLKSHLVDERFGIIAELGDLLPVVNQPNFFHAYGRVKNPAAWSGRPCPLYSGGASISQAKARLKAIGEAIERYCSSLFNVEHTEFISASNANFPLLNPASFSLFSSTQYRDSKFKYKAFTDATKIRWVDCVDLYSGNVVYAPASMVFFPYFFDHGNDEQAIVQPVSTGLACHSSFESALLSGIYEVVERDAFTITWLRGLAPPKINIDDLAKNIRKLIERFTICGYEIALLDITTDLKLPTLLAVATSKTNRNPAVTVAAATRFYPEEAAQAVLEELAHTLSYARGLFHEKDWYNQQSEISFQNTFHISFWTSFENQEKIDFLFQTDRTLSLIDVGDKNLLSQGESLETVVQFIHEIGYSVIYRDLTSSDVASLGLTVIRALIPGLHPLFFGMDSQPLGGERLHEVPDKIGIKPSIPTAFNELPHPFP
jgi:ribosomal protein S12 methylthiotransferase accessory factor